MIICHVLLCLHPRFSRVSPRPAISVFPGNLSEMQNAGPISPMESESVFQQRPPFIGLCTARRFTCTQSLGNMGIDEWYLHWNPSWANSIRNLPKMDKNTLLALTPLPRPLPPHLCQVPIQWSGWGSGAYTFTQIRLRFETSALAASGDPSKFR